MRPKQRKGMDMITLIKIIVGAVFVLIMGMIFSDMLGGYAL